MQGRWKQAGRAAVAPLVAGLERAGVTPNQVTVVGLALAIGSGILAGLGDLRLAAACFILSALCDLLDGQLARRRGQTGVFGAFLDSCLDRMAEGAIYLGLIVHLAPHAPRAAVVAGVALVGSFMVSYARARAEGLGIACTVGLMERPERLIVLIIALLVGGWVLDAALLLLATLSMATFLQRLRHVQRAAGPAGSRGAGTGGMH
jgi:CDP-diacylglycerol--glycerol-3-phosphate 3-phosphatidyltransferase